MMIFSKFNLTTLLFGQTNNIHDAAFNNDLAAINRILTDNPDCIDTFDVKTKDGPTPLQIMVLNNCFDGVKLLLEYGAEANKRSKDNLCALNFPCVHPKYTSQERKKMIQLLVDAGARLDLNEQSDVKTLEFFKKHYPDVYSEFSGKITDISSANKNLLNNNIRQRFTVVAGNK